MTATSLTVFTTKSAARPTRGSMVVAAPWPAISPALEQHQRPEPRDAVHGVLLGVVDEGGGLDDAPDPGELPVHEHLGGVGREVSGHCIRHARPLLGEP